jgi:hypothetical protein
VFPFFNGSEIPVVSWTAGTLRSGAKKRVETRDYVWRRVSQRSGGNPNGPVNILFADVHVLRDVGQLDNSDPHVVPQWKIRLYSPMSRFMNARDTQMPLRKRQPAVATDAAHAPERAVGERSGARPSGGSEYCFCYHGSCLLHRLAWGFGEGSSLPVALSHTSNVLAVPVQHGTHRAYRINEYVLVARLQHASRKPAPVLFLD